MKTTYILERDSFSVLLEYDEKKRLVKLDIKGNPLQTHYDWIINNIPTSETAIQENKTYSETYLIVPQDLSFSAFWDSYKYKQGGSKKETQKYWDNMPKEQQIKALQYIPKYDNHLKLKGTAKVYAIRYLKKEYFNN